MCSELVTLMPTEKAYRNVQVVQVTALSQERELLKFSLKVSGRREWKDKNHSLFFLLFDSFVTLGGLATSLGLSHLIWETNIHNAIC